MRAVKAKRLRRIRKAWAEIGYSLSGYSDKEILAPGFGCPGAFDMTKYECDRCGKDVEVPWTVGASRQITRIEADSMGSKVSWPRARTDVDLCDDCNKVLLEFLKVEISEEKP